MAKFCCAIRPPCHAKEPPSAEASLYLDKHKPVLVSAHPPLKICQKIPRTETGTAQPQKQVPMWHKEKGHTYIFVNMAVGAGEGALRGNL